MKTEPSTALELEDGFTTPGVIRLSPAALELARGLGLAAQDHRRADWVVVFDWATDVRVRRGPDQPYELVDDCVTVGASERSKVPPAAIQLADGIEFAIQIPKRIWEHAPERLIDVDTSLLFKLVLR